MSDELEPDRAAAEALIRDAGFSIEQLRLQGQESSDDEEADVEEVRIGSLEFALSVAPDDGEISGTLFASQIWNGAKYIAEYCHEQPTVVAGKRTIEFGAACALPSLVSLHHESSFVLVTDYPEEPILNAIRANFDRNSALLGPDVDGRSAVIGHKWGENTDSLLHFCPEGFDVAFVAECLWLHKEHRNLLESLAQSLRVGGIALISYAHHVPGCEDADDAFFDIAEDEFNLRVVSAGEKVFPKMWNGSVEQFQYLKVLKKESGSEETNLQNDHTDMRPGRK